MPVPLPRFRRSIWGAFTLTAVRNGSGNLELINWRTGPTITRQSDSGNQAGAVSEIATTRVRSLTSRTGAPLL
jgi:hypothetical protein